MDKRVRERRRLVHRERGRRRAGLIFLVVLAVLAVVSFLWLRSTSVFAVERVVAVPTEHVTERQIADAVENARGVNLLKVSTGAIEEILEALPYVRDAHVYREFPDGLEVRIEEYRPAARVQGGEAEPWLVSDDGHYLGVDRSGDAAALPLIKAAAALEARAGDAVPRNILDALPLALLMKDQEIVQSLPPVGFISVTSGGSVVVHLEDGTELRLGEPEDLKRKMKLAADIVQKYLRDGKSLEYVDASAPDRPAAKPK